MLQLVVTSVFFFFFFASMKGWSTQPSIRLGNIICNKNDIIQN